jgi:hypothetical protein
VVSFEQGVLLLGLGDLSWIWSEKFVQNDFDLELFAFACSYFRIEINSVNSTSES